MRLFYCVAFWHFCVRVTLQREIGVTLKQNKVERLYFYNAQRPQEIQNILTNPKDEMISDYPKSKATCTGIAFTLNPRNFVTEDQTLGTHPLKN